MMALPVCPTTLTYTIMIDCMRPAEVFQRISLQWLENALGQTKVVALNAYIAALPGFPGLTLPTHGLAQGEKASATQMANLFKMLPVALLAHDSVQAKFMGPIQGQHQSYVWCV